MALPKRSSPVQTQNTLDRDLKQRVICSLNKLSDRDTHAIACSELESIAQTLTPDTFSSFLSCIYSTDSSHKSPVRRQSVRLLGLMAAAHGDDLAPFLPRMVGSAIVQRLRDPDSAVRTACIEAVTQMASRITRPPFFALMRPLSEALLLEQEFNSQIGAALCLAAAIESSPTPDVAQLRRMLPRLLKVLRAPSFKAKAALLSLIGCAISAGAAHGGQVIGELVSSLVKFLSSEDWAARNGASEALIRLAITERDLLPEFKVSCLKSFEARRFDKVKAVRETMNRMLDAWRDIPDVSNNLSPPSQLKSSPTDSNNDGHSSAHSHVYGKKSDSPSSKISVSPLGRSNLVGKSEKPTSKLICSTPSACKVENAVPNDVPIQGIHEDALEVGMSISGRFSEHGEIIESRHFNSNLEVRRCLFDDKYDVKTQNFGGQKSASRVVPFEEKEISESTVQLNTTSEDVNSSHKEREISLIRQQLAQIEAQQSSLLNLLQMFIGNSQNGMHSLEARVHRLETALNEISYDLAVSTGSMGNSDTATNACFKLPGSDFLSSKLWRRSEGPRLSTAGAAPLVCQHCVTDKEATGCSDDKRFRRLVLNPLAEIHPAHAGPMEASYNGVPKNGMHNDPIRRHATSPFVHRP